MEVQHDARPAARAASSARGPNAGLRLWAWTRRAPVRRHRAATASGSAPPRTQRARRRPAPEARRCDARATRPPRRAPRARAASARRRRVPPRRGCGSGCGGTGPRAKPRSPGTLAVAAAPSHRRRRRRLIACATGPHARRRSSSRWSCCCSCSCWEARRRSWPVACGHRRRPDSSRHRPHAAARRLPRRGAGVERSRAGRASRRRGARRRRRAGPGDPCDGGATRRALRRARRAARAQRRAQHGGARRPTPPLLCFVDDDVAVRPGWLRRSRRARRARCPRTPACSPARSTRASRTTASAPVRPRGGTGDRPRPRPRGPRLRARLGREHDRAPQRARAGRPVRRGARALRRRAGVAGPLEGRGRAGCATSRPPRWTTAVRATTPACARSCRAARFRGRASRRFDVFKGTAPSLAAELRVLAGCLAHGPRSRLLHGPGHGRALPRPPRGPP